MFLAYAPAADASFTGTTETTVVSYAPTRADRYAATLLISGATGGSVLTVRTSVTRGGTAYPRPVRQETVGDGPTHLIPLSPIQVLAGDTLTVTLESDTADTLAVVREALAVDGAVEIRAAATFTDAGALQVAAALLVGGEKVDPLTLDAAATASVTFREHKAGADALAIAFVAADVTDGVFEATEASPGLASGVQYAVTASIVVDGVTYRSSDVLPVYA